MATPFRVGLRACADRLDQPVPRAPVSPRGEVQRRQAARQRTAPPHREAHGRSEGDDVGARVSPDPRRDEVETSGYGGQAAPRPDPLAGEQSAGRRQAAFADEAAEPGDGTGRFEAPGADRLAGHRAVCLRACGRQGRRRSVCLRACGRRAAAAPRGVAAACVPPVGASCAPRAALPWNGEPEAPGLGLAATACGLRGPRGRVPSAQRPPRVPRPRAPRRRRRASGWRRHTDGGSADPCRRCSVGPQAQQG